MRGSSLSHASVVEILRPFIVTSWTGRSLRDAPEQVRAIYAKLPRRMPSNIVLFVLDEQARYVDAFVAFPKGGPGRGGFDRERMGGYLHDRIREATRDMKLPRPPRTKVKLHSPDVSDLGLERGLRIILRITGRTGNYKMPTVEVLPLTAAESALLAYPEAPRAVAADGLRAWLSQLYPPAIMDSKEGITSLDGELELRPAGAGGGQRFAVLEGALRFQLDDARRTRYGGRLSLVVRYSKRGAALASFRGLFEGMYPKSDRRHNRVNELRMTAIFESRPD